MTDIIGIFTGIGVLVSVYWVYKVIAFICWCIYQTAEKEEK